MNIIYDNDKVHSRLEIWKERYNNFIQKIKEADEKCPVELSMSTNMPVSGDVVDIWFYTAPLKIRDDARKALGKWITNLLNTTGKPYTSQKLTEYETSFSWFNEFEDKHGKYIVKLTVVLVIRNYENGTA